MNTNKRTIRITLAQINPRVGDLQGNTDLIVEQINQHHARTDLIIFTELCLTAYPPEDLLLRDDFISQSKRQLNRLIAAIPADTSVIVGLPWRENDALFNALVVLDSNGIVSIYRKRLLPNYNVFDEKRYFTPGDQSQVVELLGIKFGLTICEDIWEPEPVKEAVELGAECIITINASPFHYNKAHQREEQTVRLRSKENRCGMIYVNQVGGQDELVFDGASLISDHDGEIVAQLPSFQTKSLTVTLEFDGEQKRQLKRIDQQEVLQTNGPSEDELIYQALVTGVKDYVDKNGFNKVILGLSGGIDSALVAAIAVDALGKQRVEAVMMPYRYTSQMSIEDAQQQADTMGIAYHVIPIESIVSAAGAQLQPYIIQREGDTTEENIQARTRGLLLMAISNNSGAMLLTTGNKSEMAVGYATLYGDMAGGFAVIKDVPKTRVYALARYRNLISEVIPNRVITRPPSAELRPDQTDQDSLPDYDILDGILERFVELDQSVEEIVAAGYKQDIVQKVIKLVVRNEYKRRQAAPGVRITPRAFGRDRRYPITNGFF